MSRLPSYDIDDVTDNKIWGYTDLVFGTKRFSKHFLQINENSYCSLHFHKHRANEFEVISGKLEIISFYGPVIDRVILTPGNRHIVHSLVPHLFYAHEKTIAVEEYFPDRDMDTIQESDIIRIIPGGKDKYEKLLDLLHGVFNSAIRDK